MSTVGLEIHDRFWSDETEERGTTTARVERLLPALYGAGLFLLDLLNVVSAFLLAYWMRFIVPDDEGAALGLEQYVRMGFSVGLVTTVLMALHGLYDEDRPLTGAARLQAITSAVSTALVLVVALSYFLGDQRFSRLWFATGWLFAVTGLALGRGLACPIYLAARDRIAPSNRALVVGANALGRQVARELALEYCVIGYVDNGSDLDHHADIPLLGPIAQLERLVQTYAVSELIIALPPNRREQVEAMIARGFRRRVNIKVVQDLGDLLTGRVEVHQIAGRPYIGFAPMARISWLKRATDLLLSGLCVVALSPVLAVIAILIKVDSPGPVLYRQRRVGKDGHHFWMLKFRSMRQDADGMLDQLRDLNEASGPLFKIRRDPRVTRVGRVLRRLSLDELPQLFNVVRGEMSLVGPRPPIPAEVEQYEDWQLGRLRAVPGMTGLWQVSGRSEVPFHDMVRLDLHYIRSWSLSLDLGILLRTIPAVITNRGAY